MQHIILLAHVKSTKNTEVFATTNETAVITQVYIKKSAFEGETPKTIAITLDC